MPEGVFGPGSLVEFKHAKKLELEAWLTLEQRLRTVEEALELIGRKSELAPSRKSGREVDWDAAIYEQCLYCFAVVTYMRCFSTGKKLRLDVSEIPSLTSNDRQLHESLRSLRNHHFAHAVGDVEGAQVFLDLSGTPTEPPGFSVLYAVLSSDQPAQVRKFSRLAKKIRKHVQRQATIICDLVASDLFGRRSKWVRLFAAGTSVERATPNPSIERTRPGKPGRASHVKR